MTLYTYPNNFRAYKAQIAAAYSGANVKVASQPPEFKFGETNKSEAFLQKFPTGKVPAFEGDDGVVLFGSSAIAYYLSNDELHGKNPKDAASILQWIEFAENEILPASCTWVFPCLGAMQFNKQATEKAKGDVKNALQILNNFLLSRTYLVGERISLADISVCCNLLQLFQLVLDPEFRKPYQNVLRWFTTLVNQPEFKSVLGDFEMCKKMAQFDAKKFAEVQGGGSKKEKPEKKQEKKQQQPKQEKKAKKDSNPDEVPDFPEEKKAKDPFMQLPAMNFNMDEWKKTYSNKDTATVAVPYFWEKFDKENMSIWFSEYLYPDELEMIFMSCNLVSGMFQRLDKMRKHAFASVGIFGEDNNCSISGIWVWRGQGLAFELSEDLQIDYESYKWTKLDPDNDETKKMVNEYLLWEGDFGGKNFNQGKVYK